jgi:hypothetical protein
VNTYSPKYLHIRYLLIYVFKVRKKSRGPPTNHRSTSDCSHATTTASASKTRFQGDKDVENAIVTVILR